LRPENENGPAEWLVRAGPSQGRAQSAPRSTSRKGATGADYATNFRLWLIPRPRT